MSNTDKRNAMTNRVARRAGGLLAVAGLALGTVAVAGAFGTAASAQGSSIKVSYRVTGSSHVNKTDSTLTLGPATLRLVLRNNGRFTGSLPLPPTTTSFKAAGIAPTTATVSFIPVGPVTGSLKAVRGQIQVTSNAKVRIKISNVKTIVLGVPVPVPVGDNCETTDPVSLGLTNPKHFDIVKGGVLTDTFGIGTFSHCNGSALLLNQLVSGDGNTIALRLAKGKIQQ